MGMTLVMTGDIAEARVHLDRAIALYDQHHPSLLGDRSEQEFCCRCG
jgi:hypothetical protein